MGPRPLKDGGQFKRAAQALSGHPKPRCHKAGLRTLFLPVMPLVASASATAVANTTATTSC